MEQRGMEHTVKTKSKKGNVRRLSAILLVCVLCMCCMSVFAFASEGVSAAEQTPAYMLTEEASITLDEEAAPLGAGPAEEMCCALHLVLLLCALGVTVFYTYDRKRRQVLQFQLRSELD